MAQRADALAALVDGFSSFSVFPPFGPRALARRGASALRTRQVVQWGRVVIAATIGRRSGCVARVLSERCVVPELPLSFKLVLLIMAHAALGNVRSGRTMYFWRFVAGAVAAFGWAPSRHDARSRASDAWNMVGRIGGAAVPLLGLAARSFWRRLLRGLLALATVARPLPKSPDVRIVAGAVFRAGTSYVLRNKLRALEGLLALVVLSYLVTKAPRIQRRPAPPSPKTTTPVKRRHGEPPVPRLYVQSCDGDHAKAHERWRATIEWRNERGVDRIAVSQQPKYHDIKRVYPHFLHGKTRDGAVFCWERLGRLDTSALRSGRVTTEEAFRHFIFFHEYMARRYEGEETRMVTVLDIEGLRFREVNSFFLKLISTASDVLDNLAPFRVRKIFVVNAPSWIGAAWPAVRRVLPRGVRDKVTIVGSDYASTLAEVAAPDQLPADYGGLGPPLGEADAELDMLDAVCVLNAGGSVDYLDEAKAPVSESVEVQPPAPPVEEEQSTPWYARILQSNTATPAHLGNTDGEFYYCEQKKRWVLEGNEDEAPGTPSRSVSEDDVVLAIQAATLRRSLSSEAQLGSLAQRTAEDLRRTLPNHFSAPARALRDAPPPPPQTTADPLLSAVLGLNLVSVCAANSFLTVAAPCWALAPSSQGGVGLKTADASCVMVGACFLVLALRLKAPEALAKMPRRAPLRGVRVAGAAGCLATLAAPALLAAARQEGLLPRDSIAAKVCVAIVAAAWLVTGRLGRDAAAAAAGAARGGRVRAVAMLSDAGDISGAVVASLVTTTASPQRGLYLAALGYAVVYGVSLAVYRRVLGDVSDDSDSAPCSIFLELPARDVQRIVDDMTDDALV